MVRGPPPPGRCWRYSLVNALGYRGHDEEHSFRYFPRRIALFQGSIQLRRRKKIQELSIQGHELLHPSHKVTVRMDFPATSKEEQIEGFGPQGQQRIHAVKGDE